MSLFFSVFALHSELVGDLASRDANAKSGRRVLWLSATVAGHLANDA